MGIWSEWWIWAGKLRKACSRERTFMWMLVAIAGFSIREDMLGVSSFIRCLGLQGFCYDRFLDFFHSPALSVVELSRIWTSALLECHPGIVRHDERPVLVCDGIKIGKSGKKMPGVKLLHQESESNSKPEYIMGHSCQAVCVLAGCLASVVAIPLAARIHEGLVFSNRDKRTTLDKMAALIFELGIREKFILLADAYYASKKMIMPLLGAGCHLISKAKINAVAYHPAVAPIKVRRGRKKLYGKKEKLTSMFENPESMTEAPSPIYGEKGISLRYRSARMLWKPIGVTVLFVAVLHPTRGKCLLLCTDITITPLEVIRLYGLRFKIEVSFKQSVHTVGAYLYHFWMAAMTPLSRRDGDQHLHRKTEEYRRKIRRKTEAYHRFMQVGLVAQGIMAAISTSVPLVVWKSFGSWLRTIRPNVCPSELVVSLALKNSFPEFLVGKATVPILAKFILERTDFSRKNISNIAA
jgi:hypothetical protein